MVIGLVALALAFSAFVVILRRSAPRSPAAAVTSRLADTTHQAAATAAVDPAESPDTAALIEKAERDADQLRSRAQTDADQLRDRAQADADQLRDRAAAEAEGILKRATEAAEQAAQGRREVEDEIRAVKDEIRELRGDLERREQRIGEREQRLDAEIRRLEERRQALERRRQELDEQAKALTDADAKAQHELERVAGLTAAAAKTELVANMENQAKREAAVTIRNIENEARTEADKRARKIVTLAIQRVAVEQTSESVVSVMHLPGDEMKGRIIGREGRNIRAFESITGVNLIIDDTPEAVLLSCFDPVRREIARLTLERLISDGRIHPQRIEEAYERGRAEIELLCQRSGEDAMTELGITDMHPELIALLGRLRYRTSYGQNVLGHLIESAHIAGMMASELRMDPLCSSAARCCTTSARRSPTRSRAATR